LVLSKRVLVTGGAGFIGRRVVASLLERGHKVRILDNFLEQIHGRACDRSVMSEADVVQADIRDEDALARALSGME
jgi:dTDP-L-rhamnose 4-epimerase